MNGYVHGDLKPENICVSTRVSSLRDDYTPKLGEPFQSKFEFRLIDFGVAKKFKPKKMLNTYEYFIGNLMFGSCRALRHE